MFFDRLIAKRTLRWIALALNALFVTTAPQPAIFDLSRSSAMAMTASTDSRGTPKAKLVFCEEFDSLNFRNGDKGLWDTSYYWQRKDNGSTLVNEGEWYLRHEFGPTSHIKPWSIERGVLSLTAARTDPSIAPYVEGHAYTSGVLNSGHGYSQRYGYFEIRAKVPRGQGLWPAFWLVPFDGTASHEIDVMEVVGQHPRALHTTLHVFQPEHVATTRIVRVADMSRDFHLFGVDWQPDKISWYFDRKLVFQVDTPPDLNKPMFMILNLAVGGPMPGQADHTTPLPSRFQVDYVRIYSKRPGGQPEAVAKDAACRQP